MSTSGEAADQVLRMTIEGTEAALKITGTGAEKVAVLMYRMLRDLAKDTYRTQGQIRLANMVRSGKRHEVFEISDEKLKRFAQMAKIYGVVYTVLKDRKAGDGKCEIMVKADDAQKVSHIFYRMDVAVNNTGTVETDAAKVKEAFDRAGNGESREESASELPGSVKNLEPGSNGDMFLNELMRKPETKRKEEPQNPLQARSMMPGQSVPGSESRENSRAADSDMIPGVSVTSVRVKLRKYRAEIDRAAGNAAPELTPAKSAEQAVKKIITRQERV